jgi:Protein involved in formate dehydrogenase formation
MSPMSPVSPWTAHRRRAHALRVRHPFAGEVLGLYLALLDVWDDAWRAARDAPPVPGAVAGWAADRVLPRVVAATEAAGPEPLAKAGRDLLDAGRLDPDLPVRPLAGWLAGDGLAPVERYLARASLYPVLVALGADAGAACAGDPSGRDDRRDDRHCPRCGGPPQLSFRADAGDALVSGGRRLACARCGHDWAYSASACPSCGETSGARRTLYAEERDGPAVGRDSDGADGAGADGAGAAADPPTFPSLRLETCASCRRYLLDVDLGRDPGAVPEVDELAALPLDLFAAEQELSKITPNLMGF